jgi:hypothetical protein
MTNRHPDRASLTDLLADLDAGLLDPTAAARVRAAAAQDTRAGGVLDGLAATRAELGRLGDPPVPPEFAARWDAALAEEAVRSSPSGSPSDADGAPAPAQPAPAVEPSEEAPAPDSGQAVSHGDARPARRSIRRAGRAGRRLRPALVAAAVLVGAVVASLPFGPREPAPLSLDGVDLAAAGLAVQGDLDVGVLADPARRAGCLRAAAPQGVTPDAPLLGGRDVVVAGRPGVLLLLATGRARPGMHVVVVDPECGPQGGDLLRAQAIGG